MYSMMGGRLKPRPADDAGGSSASGQPTPEQPGQGQKRPMNAFMVWSPGASGADGQENPQMLARRSPSAWAPSGKLLSGPKRPFIDRPSGSARCMKEHPVTEVPAAAESQDAAQEGSYTLPGASCRRARTRWAAGGGRPGRRWAAGSQQRMDSYAHMEQLGQQRLRHDAGAAGYPAVPGLNAHAAAQMQPMHPLTAGQRQPPSSPHRRTRGRLPGRRPAGHDQHVPPRRRRGRAGGPGRLHMAQHYQTTPVPGTAINGTLPLCRICLADALSRL
uniref:Uncharacterized protein n=1 Tax=Sphaerodactylus townsendi TaxID=933632 RepID=A0ACB8FAZ9_9SAUR